MVGNVYRITFQHPVPEDPDVVAGHGAWLEKELNIMVDEQHPDAYDRVLQVARMKYPRLRMVELRLITEVDIQCLSKSIT